MVCGTASDVGKSHLVTGLCRLLARRGVRVAPFKAQNMSLNSWVTAGGHEIGRAQGVKALAAGVEPEVAMNPILLKPTGERASQVVVMGRPLAHLEAAAYHAEQPRLQAVVAGALSDLRSRFDVVVAEGAGGCAEINLVAHDLVNLPLARSAGLPALVVGDIDRGGVFASLYGSLALLPDELRATVRAFVVNKFRGDPALLGDGTGELERRCGVPTLGAALDRRRGPRRRGLPRPRGTPSPGPGRPDRGGHRPPRRGRDPLPSHRQRHRPRRPLARTRGGGPPGRPGPGARPSGPGRAARHQGHRGRPGLAAGIRPRSGRPGHRRRGVGHLRRAADDGPDDRRPGRVGRGAGGGVGMARCHDRLRGGQGDPSPAGDGLG